MRITPNNTFPPMHIARAYGVSPARTGRFETAANTQAPAARNLVAGSVSQPVNFEATRPTAGNSSAALQMYTRAADRVEASVRIAIGRTIDVKG